MRSGPARSVSGTAVELRLAGTFSVLRDGGAWMLGYEVYLSLAEAWLGHGEPDRARAVLAPLLAVAEREPWIPALAAALAADGRALARLGQREQARAALQRAARLAGEHGLPHVLRAASEAGQRLG